MIDNASLFGGYESGHTNRLLARLDVIETALYRDGQETKGDPDPATFAELDRWTPEELEVSQEDIDNAGALLFEASDLVHKALALLDKNQESEPFQEVGG